MYCHVVRVEAAKTVCLETRADVKSCCRVEVHVAAHATESVSQQGGLTIYLRYTDGETGGITDSESEFVFKTEPTERGCHGDGCYAEEVQISLLTGRG